MLTCSICNQMIPEHHTEPDQFDDQHYIFYHVWLLDKVEMEEVGSVEDVLSYGQPICEKCVNKIYKFIELIKEDN